MMMIMMIVCRWKDDGDETQLVQGICLNSKVT